MKQISIIFIICAILSSCSSSDDPKIEFTAMATTGEVQAVSSNSASVFYEVSVSYTSVSKAGVAIFKDNELVQQVFSPIAEWSGWIEVTGLSPETSYIAKAVLVYPNPNTKETEYKYGNGVAFTTEAEQLTIKQPSFQVMGGHTITSYRSGNSPVEISSNFGNIGKVVIEASTDPNFSEIAFSKESTIIGSYSEQSIPLPQGKYYCRVRSLYHDNMISNSILIRVIKQRGTIVEDGYVDLGLDAMWSAQFYSEPGTSKTKYTFAAATIQKFDGILEPGDSFSGTQYDYLTSKLGLPYRTPTLEEFEILEHACMWEQDGESFIITGCTGNAIRLKFYSDDYISGWAYGYQLYSNYTATSTLYNLGMIWSYHLSTPDGKLGFNYWPYNSISNGFLLWPVK